MQGLHRLLPDAFPARYDDFFPCFSLEKEVSALGQ